MEHKGGGGGKYHGAGRVLERQRAREIRRCEGFRSSSSAVLAAGGVGESVSGHGGCLEGRFSLHPELHFQERHIFPFQKVTLFTRTKKERKIMAGAVNSSSE